MVDVAFQERAKASAAYGQHPALLRLEELETLRALARNANARLYIGFDKHLRANADGACHLVPRPVESFLQWDDGES